MAMVRYDDDDDDDENQRLEGSLCEILMARLYMAYGDAETRVRRGVEEEERNRFLIDTLLSVATESFFGEANTDDALDSQQNPNHRDASSSSMSSVEPRRRLVVPDDEPISAEPIREIKPSVRGKSVKGLKKKGKVLRGSGSSHGHANDENMEVDPNADTVLGVATEAFLGKRKRKIDEYESQQNPNRHDASSSRFSSVEAVRRERRVMPEWLVNRMREENGADAKLVTEKDLKKSDVKTQQSRLLIPFNQIEEMDFLNEAELNIIEKDRSKSRKEGVPVTLVDSSGRKQWNVSLKRWDMKTSSNYLLNSGWNDVVRHHSLKEGKIIRLWTFRSQKGKLFFALELVPRPPPAPAMASDPDMALAPALAQAQAPVPVPAAASSSTPAPVVTRDSHEELYIGEASRLKAQEERNRYLVNFPKRRRGTNVRVPAPARDSGNLGQSIVEGMDLNRTLGQVCTEMAPVEAEEETNSKDLATVMRAAEILLQLASRDSGQNS